MATRDPRQDPQVGDYLYKISESSGKRMSRRVVRRDVNDIYFVDQHGKERMCWITTWCEWARMAELEQST